MDALLCTACYLQVHGCKPLGPLGLCTPHQRPEMCIKLLRSVDSCHEACAAEAGNRRLHGNYGAIILTKTYLFYAMLC